MQKLSLNRNQLKYLAISAMLIDHIAWLFVPTASALGQIMHFFGRLTAPTMAYFLAEGYSYTKDFKKYAVRMGIFALISWAPFVYMEYGVLPVSRMGDNLVFHFEQGVIFSLFWGLIAMKLWDTERFPKWLRILGIAAICFISLWGDWMFIIVLWALSFHIWQDDYKAKWTAFFLVSSATVLLMLYAGGWLQICQTGVFLAPIIITRFYNGGTGKKSAFNKWFFYIFYPVHMAVLGVIAHIIMVK